TEIAQRLVERNSDINTTSADKISLRQLQFQVDSLRVEAKALIKANDPILDTNDVNYIFIDFITRYLPIGLIGLLIAVIFSASMSSTSSELNALASTSIMDIYKRSIMPTSSEEHYFLASKIGTLIWGVIAIIVANLATKMGSLIEAVNILGSIFYGTILGVFLVAFFVKFIKGN